jgi:pimeloyl-ACP methyl ester carboxylesterase
LIAYYHPFLSLLANYLKEDEKSSFQIYGGSLGGFEIGEDSPKDLDLEDQILFVQKKLANLMDGCDDNASANADVNANGDSNVKSRPKVILIGHSVGSYIAMEILRRHRENSGPTSFDITGGAMLFPTVKDIAASPSGQKLTVCCCSFKECKIPPNQSQTLLSVIPRLALVVSFFARILTVLLPVSLLRSVIRVVMDDPPSHALETTCSFLKSRGGVRQALYVISFVVMNWANLQGRHMAADEMRTITSDRWSDDVWGVAKAHEPITRLFFYFGRNDHWVAERTRDEIVALRGRDGGPTMVVCEEGLPHAFCLSESFFFLVFLRFADFSRT